MGHDALELEPQLAAASAARRHVRLLLDDWGLDALVEPVLLLTSELVTNAVLHSGTAIVLRVRREGAGVRIGVEDGSSVPPVRRRRSTNATTGRGIALLEQVSSTWGWEPVGTGKRVWFTVLSDRRWEAALDVDGLAEAEW